MKFYNTEDQMITIACLGCINYNSNNGKPCSSRISSHIYQYKGTVINTDKWYCQQDLTMYNPPKEIIYNTEAYNEMP